MNTPRTDAALPSAVALRDSVLADLCRTIERELSAKSAECQRLREALETVISWQDGSPLVGGRGLPPNVANQVRAALQEVQP